MATAAAKRYARAVFELAVADRDVDAWSRRLAQVQTLLHDETVATVLTNPTISSERRMELVSGGGLDGEASNLVKLLIESGRVHEIDGIAGEFEHLADDAAGRVRATVTTAVELAPGEQDELARKLGAHLGMNVALSAQVDPRVLGGLKLQYGDRLIDATVATRLQQLRRRLIEA